MSAEAFAARARERSCEVIRCQSPAEARESARALAEGHLAIVDAATGIDLATAEDPWEAEVGLTVAMGAAADTGTVALARRSGTTSASSILPFHSIVLLAEADVLPTYEDLVQKVASLDPRPSQIQLVTGPSRSGDVQGMTVRGMHGPAKVTVILY